MSKGISETAFASQVEDLLKIFGWRWCHFRPALTGAGWRTAMKGYKGFPDYICARPPRLLFAELKDEVKPTTPEQDGWLEDLRGCSADATVPMADSHGYDLLTSIIIPEVYLWRPSQIEEIRDILR